MRVDAGDALDERRLAGAVVADEGHDLAGRDVEVDLVERLHRAEAFETPRSSRTGVSLTSLSSSSPVTGRPAAPPRGGAARARIVD